MTSNDTVQAMVEQLRDRDAIAMSGLFHAVPVMQAAAALLLSLQAENERLRGTLTEISKVKAAGQWWAWVPKAAASALILCNTDASRESARGSDE